MRRPPPPPIRVGEMMRDAAEKLGARYEAMLRGEVEPVPDWTAVLEAYRQRTTLPPLPLGEPVLIPLYLGPGVYVFWMQTGPARRKPLYIGKGNMVLERAFQHLRNSPWWAEWAHEMTFIPTATGRDALRLETQMVRELQRFANVCRGECDSCGRTARLYPLNAVTFDKLCAACKDPDGPEAMKRLRAECTEDEWAELVDEGVVSG